LVSLIHSAGRVVGIGADGPDSLVGGTRPPLRVFSETRRPFPGLRRPSRPIHTPRSASTPYGPRRRCAPGGRRRSRMLWPASYLVTA